MTTPGSRRGATAHWCAGRPVELLDQEWSDLVTGFLGSGFRVRFPHVARAVEHARRQVDAIATLLGTPVDGVPWAALGGAAAYEVAGGWAYGLDRVWGPPWTAVTPLEPGRAVEGERARAAVDLPWAWSSRAVTAGLPMISTLEDHLARRHAGDRVGLWWDHRDLLCSTTAGPPLVQLDDGSWRAPDPASGAVRSWAYDEAARDRAARPAELGRELVAAARAVVAVSDLGVETRLTGGWPRGQ